MLEGHEGGNEGQRGLRHLFFCSRRPVARFWSTTRENHLATGRSRCQKSGALVR